MSAYVKICEGVYRVGGAQWADPAHKALSDGSNVYLIHFGDEWVLFDCSMLSAHSQINSNIAAIPGGPKKLDRVFLTHSHFDHAQGLMLWKKQFGMQTYLNHVGVEHFKKGDLRLAGYAIMGPEADAVVPDIDHAICDGDSIRVASVDLEVIGLPGHTPDMTGFLFAIHGKRILVSGDLFFGSLEPGKGMLAWLSILWKSSVKDYIESLERVRAIDIDIILPGHGKIMEGDAIKSSLEAALERLRQIEKTSHHVDFGVMS